MSTYRKAVMLFFYQYLSCILKNLNLSKANLFKFSNSYINLPFDHVRFGKKLGPIRSAVLTFIGYKQTNRQ